MSAEMLTCDDGEAIWLASDRCFRRHAAQLESLPGWYALIRGDQLAGVFPNAADAIRVGFSKGAGGQRDIVVIRRIGGGPALVLPDFG